jgi:CRP-like cAMP-binding protein
MAIDLIEYLSRSIPMTDEVAAAIREVSLVRSYPKGKILLRQGEAAGEGYLILEGCVRSYVLKEGDDKTLDFFVEEELVVPLELGNGLPSSHFLECAEETVAVVSTPEQEKRMLEAYPHLKAVCLAMSEMMAGKLRESLARYRSSSPEERYMDLLDKRPALLQRIPQYQIASYLGVQPESLSRIRRRLAKAREKTAVPDRS